MLEIVEFLDLLLSKSQNETIKIEENDSNKNEYHYLLNWFSVNTRWILQNEDKSWYFASYSSKENFQQWLGEERERQIKDRASRNLLEFWKLFLPKLFVLEMPIVSQDQD